MNCKTIPHSFSPSWWESSSVEPLGVKSEHLRTHRGERMEGTVLPGLSIHPPGRGLWKGNPETL